MKPTLILIMLICTAWCENAMNPTESKLPTEAETLVSLYDADVAKIQADADKAIQAKTDALRTKLAKAQESATKKGNLEGALAIKGAIEKLPKSERPKDVGVHTSSNVILYTEPNFKGMPVTVKQFNVVIEAYKVSFPNDGLRSIKIPKGYTFVAYAADFGGGTSTEYTSDTPNVTDAPGMGMTSFMIKAPGK